ncbi:putative tRNA(His) guanylyltransferase [Cryptosporidium serpentis]
MACSKYEYVKSYEQPNRVLNNSWFVVRIDGCSFHEFTKDHNYDKPNDKSGLDLMNRAAESVMKKISDIIIAYGQSDEYRRKTDLWGRRSDKILTYTVSLFTSSFVYYWDNFFPKTRLTHPPTFDGRIIIYPTDKDMRDYLSWRQVDCHINNLYNTCFWALVKFRNISEKEATELLKHSVSSDKNELLFSEFNINYSEIPKQFRKGTVLYRPKRKAKKTRSEYFKMRDIRDQEVMIDDTKDSSDEDITHPIWRCKYEEITINNILKCHQDIIQDAFWIDNEYLLA